MASTEESDNAGIFGSSAYKSFGRFKASACRDPLMSFPIIACLVLIIAVLGIICGLIAIRVELNKLQAQKSVAYTRWGKKNCSGDSNLIYSGFVAGSASNTRFSTKSGGGSQYLCMPTTEIEWNKYNNHSKASSWLFGAEYLHSYLKGRSVFSDDVFGHSVPCSLCLSPRPTKLMIPARRTCPSGWSKEYEGYLMTSNSYGLKKTFECVDAQPDIIEGSANSTGGPKMYFVTGSCKNHGEIYHCPPYVHARELTCVMCTK